MATAPSVVIVTRDGGLRLERCVRALQAQAPPPPRIVVVVSSQRPVAVPAGVERLELGSNRGYAAAANAGLRALAGLPVVLLNDDTEAAPGFLAALVAAARRGGEGIYQPRILLADGSDRVDNTGHRLFPDGFNMAWGRGRSAAAALDQRPEAGSFSGAAVMFTAGVLPLVGLFDEDLEAFGEDTDLSFRALRLGFRVTTVPDAVVRHELGATYGRYGARKVFLVERNRVLLAARSLPATAVLTMPAWSAWRLLMLAGASLGGRGPGAGVGTVGAAAALAGGLAGVARLPQAAGKRRADRPRWTASDGDLWRHLWRHRVRLRDLGGRA